MRSAAPNHMKSKGKSYVSQKWRTLQIWRSAEFMKNAFSTGSRNLRTAPEQNQCRRKAELSFPVIPCRSVSFPVVPCYTLSFPVIPCRSLLYPVIPCLSMWFPVVPSSLSGFFCAALPKDIAQDMQMGIQRSMQMGMQREM